MTSPRSERRIDQKKAERIQFDHFISLTPELAEATIDPDETPDFLAILPDQTIGVALTEYHRGTASKASISQREREMFERKVVTDAQHIRDAIERFESCRRVTRSLPAYNVRSHFHYPVMSILPPFCDQRGMGPPGAQLRSMVGLAQRPGPLRRPAGSPASGPAWELRTSGST